MSRPNPQEPPPAQRPPKLPDQVRTPCASNSTLSGRDKEGQRRREEGAKGGEDKGDRRTKEQRGRKRDKGDEYACRANEYLGPL